VRHSYEHGANNVVDNGDGDDDDDDDDCDKRKR
jgi:hypothetical protein